MLRIFKLRAMAFVAITFLTVLGAGLAHAATAAQMDQDFVALRKAAFNGAADEAQALADRLSDYHMPSYVAYYRIKTYIKDLPEKEIRAFLTHYQGSAIADRLRNDWLLELGKQDKWRTFDQQYPKFVLKDDAQLRCYALKSRAVKGKWVPKQAHALLAATRQIGDGCMALVTYLHARRQFKSNDIWTLIRRTTERGQKSLTLQLATLVKADERNVERAFEHSDHLLMQGPGKAKNSRETFLMAVSRKARVDYQQAARHLARFSRKLRPEERRHGWSQIARHASVDWSPHALRYWRYAGQAPLTESGHQWKARAALLAGKWWHVRAAILKMPKSLRKKPTWVYWLGRAYKETGRPKTAKRLFRSLADGRDFYGQLALEELGGKSKIPPIPEAPSEKAIAHMAANPGLQRALKMFEMNLRLEGLREWNWQVRDMKEPELLAAAEFARRSHVLDRMVSTSERTRKAYHFTQRFPTPHRDLMKVATEKLGLDMAWVYGLIRQESRFLMNARSHAGASGLMQVMPGTAELVAKKIGMENFHHEQMNNLETNIQLGTNYLKMMHDEANGSQAMASAAYNAGPHRLRAWRSRLTRKLEGAIFAELIPFYETRGYVKNVMSNATYYAVLFEGTPQSLRARMGMVAPVSGG